MKSARDTIGGRGQKGLTPSRKAAKRKDSLSLGVLAALREHAVASARPEACPQIAQITQITRGKRLRRRPHAKTQRGEAGLGNPGFEQWRAAVWLAAHFNGRVFDGRGPRPARQSRCETRSAECRVKRQTKATALTAENAENAEEGLGEKRQRQQRMPHAESQRCKDWARGGR